MLRQSPFHERVAAANQTSLWSHWAGHLVVDKYQMAEKWEYTAIRNAARDAAPAVVETKLGFPGRPIAERLAELLIAELATT